MIPKPIRADALARLFEQSTRAVHSSGHAEGLFPAQWTALRYFAHAEKTHRTAIGLARFQGMAFGPVSRTVRTLVSKGLLRRAGSAGRGRAELLELSELGEKMLARDPLEAVAQTFAELQPGERIVLATVLEQIVTALQGRGGDEQSGEDGEAATS